MHPSPPLHNFNESFLNVFNEKERYKELISQSRCGMYKTYKAELKSLSMRGPGRRDICNITDFSQTFTVYEDHEGIQESKVVRAHG